MEKCFYYLFLKPWKLILSEYILTACGDLNILLALSLITSVQ